MTTSRPEEKRHPAPFDSKHGVIAVVLVHLLIVLPLSLHLCFWVDETYTLYTTSGTLAEALARAVGFERQAPGYFVALWFFRALDSDFRFTRLFSVIATTALLFVAAGISRRMLPRAPRFLVPAILAVHPTVIAAAVETRVYALTALLAGCIVLGFLQAMELRDTDADRGFSKWVRSNALLIASAIAALYTQYYLGFLLAALGGALIVHGRFADARRYLFTMVIVGVAALPAFQWASLQAHAPDGTTTAVFSNRGAIGYLLYVLSESLIPGYGFLETFDSVAAGRAFGWIARAIALVLGVIAWRKLAASGSTSERRTLSLLFVAVVLVAFQFMLVGRYFNEYVIDLKRYWAFDSVIGAIVVTGLLLLALGKERSASEGRSFAMTPVLAIVIASILAIEIGLGFVNHRALAKQGDAERVARFLMANERKDQTVVVFPNELVLPLRLYYRGLNVLAPVPHEPVLDHFDPADPRIESKEQLERFFASVHGDSIWLVSNPKTDSWGILYNTELLYESLDAHFTVKRAQTFYPRVDVRLLERRR